MLTFVSDIIAALNVGESDVHVGIMRFHKFGAIDVYLEDYYDKPSILKEMAELEQVDQPTETSFGLRLMREEFFNAKFGNRKDVPDIALMITSQDPDENPTKAWLEATLAQTEGIQLAAVGITDSVSAGFLEGIASVPENVFHVANYTDLYDILQSVVHQVFDNSMTTVCIDQDMQGRTWGSFY